MESGGFREQAISHGGLGSASESMSVILCFSRVSGVLAAAPYSGLADHASQNKPSLYDPRSLSAPVTRAFAGSPGLAEGAAQSVPKPSSAQTSQPKQLLALAMNISLLLFSYYELPTLSDGRSPRISTITITTCSADICHISIRHPREPSGRVILGSPCFGGSNPSHGCALVVYPTDPPGSRFGCLDPQHDALTGTPKTG